MAKEVKIRPLRGRRPEDFIKWARNLQVVVDDALREVAWGAAIFIWNDECVTVPTSTTIAGAEEIVFTSSVANNGSLFITGVGFEGGITVALNGTDLGTLNSTDTTNEITYEIAIDNLVDGFNTFKIWSVSSDAGELRRLEVRGVDLGGFNAFGALASQLVINDGVTIFEPGGASTRRLGNGFSFLGVTDGQSVTFSPARAEIPDIFFIGGGAGMPTGTTATGLWYRDVRAVNSSSGGFDVHAKFEIAAGSPTNVTDSTSSGSSSTNWVIEKSATQESNNDTYVYQYDVTAQEANTKTTGGEEIILFSTITVAFDTRTTSGGAWTERDSQVFANEDTVNDLVLTNLTRNIIVDGLGADAAFRVRVKATSQNGGSIPSFDQVTYSHSGSGAASQTMTPGNGESDIIVLIVGGGEATVS